MKVIGTAGHIDHGKSTLVRRLTGIDPDRLQEEKARGMTIDLGFAWMDLPSAGEVSIVDVPGHERFVKNMLAGAGGIDVGLLVVAADEGVMPQTREHLDILDLLGVESGVAAVTKSDLVDAEWLELAEDDVAEALTGTVLQGSPIIPVSATTGDGLPVLIKALDEAVRRAPERVDEGVPYLPIDRVFTISGFGTVVTGTLHRGNLATGTEVEVLPSGRRARVRALQTHRYQVDRAGPGTRLAVNLMGTPRDEVQRGDMLALPGTLRAVDRFDARVRVLPDAPFELRHGLETTVHLGSAEVPARLLLPGRGALSPGETGWARLSLARPAAAIKGQRFILRLPAPARTVAGGEIVDVAPVRRRRGGEERLTALASPELKDALLGLLADNRPSDEMQAAIRLGTGKEGIGLALQELLERGALVRVGNQYLSPDGWQESVARACSFLDQYHKANPLRSGMSREELREKLGWSRQAWPAALGRLVSEGVVVEHGTDVALPGRQGGTASRPEDAAKVLKVLERDPLSPPSGQDLLAAAGVRQDLLEAMVKEGSVVRLSEGLYLSAAAYGRAVDVVLDLIRREGQVAVAQVRDELRTSRKYAVGLLEYLDSKRITRRQGDARVLGSQAPSCA